MKTFKQCLAFIAFYALLIAGFVFGVDGGDQKIANLFQFFAWVTTGLVILVEWHRRAGDEAKLPVVLRPFQVFTWGFLTVGLASLGYYFLAGAILLRGFAVTRHWIVKRPEPQDEPIDVSELFAAIHQEMMRRRAAQMMAQGQAG